MNAIDQARLMLVMASKDIKAEPDEVLRVWNRWRFEDDYALF